LRIASIVLSGHDEVVKYLIRNTGARLDCLVQFVQCRFKPSDFFVKCDVFGHDPALLQAEGIKADLLVCYSQNNSGAWRDFGTRPIAPHERKCHTCCKGVIMTNEQMKALAAVRAAFVAAETTGLTEAEICRAAVTGLVHPEVKSGRPPVNYNPITDCLDKPKNKAQHG
jgi:hypothetical protein